VAAYRKRHPGVRILLRELQPAEAREALEHGEVDLAIVDGKQGEPWRNEEFLIVAAPGIRWKDSLPFIAFARGTATREALHAIIPDAFVAMELGSIAAVKGHVAQGIGIALLSRAAVERDLSAGRLIELSHPRTPIPRTLSLLHRGIDRLPPAARALRDLLLEERVGAAPRKRTARRRRS
jgi:DNA-binding transcriptional LysR family regulator